MSLLITNAGIKASIKAGDLGVSYKITHISIGTEGYTPTADQTKLRSEIEKRAITRGAIIGNGKLHFETVWDGDEEFEGKELGYWLEDGTLFAVDSRDGAVITYKQKDTVITEAFELNLAASSIQNITVELKGAPYATEELAGIAKITTNENVDSGDDDKSFLTVKKLVYALGVPHVVDKLVNKLWLKLAARIFPVGAAIPWFTDVAPEGFAIMKNQAFDTNVYTELAKIWPDGVIPGMQGCGVIGKEDGETVGEFKEGQVKEHGHPGSTASSTDIGAKSTNRAGAHTHTLSIYGDSGRTNKASTWGHSTYFGKATTDSSGEHEHQVTIGSHAHTLAIALFGALKNTIDHRKVNWIVRMA